MRKIYYLPVFAAFTILFSCKSNIREVDQTTDTSFRPSDVTTILSYKSNLTQEIMLTGKVITDPDKTISYRSLTGGIITNTYFKLGDKVEKGQKLVELMSPELSSLQSELTTARGELRVAIRELETIEGMYADQITSEKELIEARNKVTRLKAIIDKTEADMSIYGVSSNNGRFTIQAPASGVIIQKDATAGSTVSTDSDPLFTIADLNTVCVIANIYAGNISYARENAEVEIESIAYPDEKFTGKIDHISNVFDPEDRTLNARISISDKSFKLKPEMSVIVKLKRKSDEQMVTIPAGTLIFDHNKYYVVTYNNHKAEIKEISISDRNSKECYIASGINEGETIISKNQLLIYAGLKEN